MHPGYRLPLSKSLSERRPIVLETPHATDQPVQAEKRKPVNVPTAVIPLHRTCRNHVHIRHRSVLEDSEIDKAEDAGTVRLLYGVMAKRELHLMRDFLFAPSPSSDSPFGRLHLHADSPPTVKCRNQNIDGGGTLANQCRDVSQQRDFARNKMFARSCGEMSV